MKRVIISVVGLLFFTGCAQKNEIKYYLLGADSAIHSEVKSGGAVFVESVSYLSGDKIWYLKDGLFLPYKNSFFAKTPKEFVAESIQTLGIDETIIIKITDAYQAYDGDKSFFLLSATIAAGNNSKKIYKNFKIKSNNLGIGAKEAIKGFEMCVSELLIRIKTDFINIPPKEGI